METTTKEARVTTKATDMSDYCDGYLAKIASGKQGPERARLAKAEQDRRAAAKDA